MQSVLRLARLSNLRTMRSGRLRSELGNGRNRLRPRLPTRNHSFVGRPQDFTGAHGVRTYLDSDVLIWYLRGEPAARTFFRKLRKLGTTDLWVGALQRAEIVFFMRPHEERLTLEFLSRFKTPEVTEATIDLGSSLYRKWQKSHGTDVNDAILAATAIKTKGAIFTLNTKHFPMHDLEVMKAWSQ